MNRPLAVLVTAALAVSAQAASVGVDVSASFDDTGGTAYDAEVRFAPTERLTLRAGAGRSSGSEDTADLAGTLLNAGISWNGERAGASLDYRTFDDGADYRTRTAAARAWIAAGDFQFAVLGRHRDSRVGLTIELPLRDVRREVDYAAIGAGLEVSYARGNVAAYAMALRYEYDDEFDDFVALANSPTLAERPRIEALVGSFQLQAQGAIDRQWGAGVERQFGRHSVSLDLASVHDAMLDADSHSIAATYRGIPNARFDWSVTAGLIDSDVAGEIGFVGVSAGITN